MTDNRRNVYFFYKKQDDLVHKVEGLTSLASENGFTVVQDAKQANIIVSIGGDGTFLQAVRKTGFRRLPVCRDIRKRNCKPLL